MARKTNVRSLIKNATGDTRRIVEYYKGKLDMMQFYNRMLLDEADDLRTKIKKQDDRWLELNKMYGRTDAMRDEYIRQLEYEVDHLFCECLLKGKISGF